MSLSGPFPGHSSEALCTLPGGKRPNLQNWPKVPPGASLRSSSEAFLEAPPHAPRGTLADSSGLARSPPGSVRRISKRLLEEPPRSLFYRLLRFFWLFLKSGLWAQTGIRFSPILWHIYGDVPGMALSELLCSTAPLKVVPGSQEQVPQGKEAFLEKYLFLSQHHVNHR